MAGTMETTALTPYLQGLRDQLRALREEAETATSELTEAQWNWSPSPDRWSIAQILDHLNKVGSTILPHFETALAELKRRNARNNGPFRYSGFERFTIRLLSPNPPFKIPVPPSFAPSAPTNLDSTVLADYLQLQNALCAFVESANGYDLAGIKVTSPASRFFRLRLGAYLESTVTHEQYHWQQVQELLAHPDFPAW
jgi:hypothetical protein